jgi:hypothetical protein
MTGLSRDETVSIVFIGVTVAIFAWYQTGVTGIQRWVSTTIAFLVSIAVATSLTTLLKRWDPIWYRS